MPFHSPCERWLTQNASSAWFCLEMRGLILFSFISSHQVCWKHGIYQWEFIYQCLKSSSLGLACSELPAKLLESMYVNSTRKSKLKMLSDSLGLMTPALWQEFVNWRFTVCDEWSRHHQHCFAFICMKQDPKSKIFLRHYPGEIYAVRCSYFD